jgi:hypothetical protein
MGRWLVTATEHTGGAPDWLDQLTTTVVARIGELIRNIAGGSDEERAADLYQFM